VFGIFLSSVDKKGFTVVCEVSVGRYSILQLFLILCFSGEK